MLQVVGVYLLSYKLIMTILMTTKGEMMTTTNGNDANKYGNDDNKVEMMTAQLEMMTTKSESTVLLMTNNENEMNKQK